jgi:hypothetical protein
LLKINENQNLNIELLPRSPTPRHHLLPSVDRRWRIYVEVINQIERIIMSRSPEQCVDSVQRLLEFLKQQNISTEEIQKKVITQAIMKRAKKDQIFHKQLLQWEETAPETARFSLVGQSVRLAIALIWPQVQSP